MGFPDVDRGLGLALPGGHGVLRDADALYGGGVVIVERGLVFFLFQYDDYGL
jgi:hypothetical protein